MADLLIDAGNSRIKLARATPQGIDALAALPFDDDALTERFRQAVCQGEGDRIVLASVSKGARGERLEALLADTGLPVLRLGSLAALGRLRVAYPLPAQLGIDRFLALLAASDTPEPCLLVSFGTALTIDALDADGRHLGGIIAPGPECQLQAMRSTFTGLFDGNGQARVLADNTDDALASGIAHQVLGAIERTLDGAFARRDVRIWASGGAAGSWLPMLPASSRLAPDILFRGMQRYLALAAQ